MARRKPILINQIKPQHYHLNLEDWETVETLRNDYHAIKLVAAYHGRIKCEKCGQLFFHSTPTEMDCAKRTIKDIPAGHALVTIFISNGRAHCPHCGARFTPQYPGIDASHAMTERLRESIEDEFFFLQTNVLSKKYGTSASTIARIGERLIAQLDAQRPIETPIYRGG